MFDFIQHLKHHKPVPLYPHDFSSEYDEGEYVGFSLGDDEAYDRYAFVNPEHAGTKTLFDLGGYFANQESDPAEKRFLKGSHTKTRLATALAAMGNEALLKKTLLWPEVSKEEADHLFMRFCRKAAKVDVREANKLAKKAKRKGAPNKKTGNPVEPFTTDQSFRFFTLLHKVVHLCDVEAVNAAKKMIHQLDEAFSQVSGVSCLGVPEFEIISRSKVRHIRELTLSGKKNLIGSDGTHISKERRVEIEKTIESQEFRKLDVLEGLSKDNDESLYANDSSEILVHFHGIVCASSQKKFDELLKVLECNPSWKIQPRQIDLTCLTVKYGKRVKSVTDNFRDISDYIVKGGNDWIAKKSYLRYKLRFSSGMALSEDEIDNLNWRTDQLLRQDRTANDGVEDLLSLSVNEINVLAKTISAMMNSKRNGKGHIFCHGRW